MAAVYIDIQEFPARFEEAVGRVERGDEVFITQCKLPVFRLVRCDPLPNPDRPPRKLGLHAGTTTLSPDFNAPLPDSFWGEAAK